MFATWDWLSFLVGMAVGQLLGAAIFAFSTNYYLRHRQRTITIPLNAETDD
jgi:hypothetical protein